MVLVASFPVVFFFAVLRPRREHVSWAIAVTYFGVLWIGIALVHAIWLRDLPHGDGLVIDVLVATFLGDTFAYFGGRMYGRTPLAPADLAEQDARGPRGRRARGRRSRSGSPGSTRTG